MSSTIPEIIIHYQKSIEKSENDRNRLLHCLGKLYKLPITVHHLQETGIGRTVNTLRKDDGEVGVAAKALVAKWKAMVAAEESSEDDNNVANSNIEDDDDASPDVNPANVRPSASDHKSSHRSKDDKVDADHINHRSAADKSNGNHKKSSSSSSHSQHKERVPSLVPASEASSSKNQPTSSSSTHKSSSSSEHKRSSSHHGRKESTKLSSSFDLDMFKPDVVTNITAAPTKSTNPNPSNSSNKEHRSSKSHKTSSRSKNEDVDKPALTKPLQSPEKHKSRSTESSSCRKSELSSKMTPPAAKRPKIEVDSDDMEEIDSSMGTSFADALGMASPSKKSGSKIKKSIKPNIKTGLQSSPKPSSISKVNVSGTPSSSSLGVKPLPKPDRKIDLKKPPSNLISADHLQPLGREIALELPSISNNYRPMPVNPLIMDCVYKTTPQPAAKMFMTDEELGASMSSKTQRTKVYSGVKTGALHNVTSLHEMCIRVLQRNIDALEFTGGVPFDIIKPVIERATPKQLFTMEDYNPYLIEDTDELWRLHCSRKFRTQKPREFESWREMFLRCTEEQDDRLSHLTNNIKQSQKIAVPVKQTKITYVDSVVKPPRDVLKKQIRYNTERILVATPAARVPTLNNTTSNIARAGDVRLRVAAGTRDNAQVNSSFRPKKAPLMAKTLQLMKGRFKR